MARAMQRCASRPASGGAANQGEDGGPARRTLAGAGRWRGASGGVREPHSRLSKIGSVVAGPEGDSAAQEVKKMLSGAESARWWCPGPDFPTGTIAPVAGDWFLYSKNR